MKKIAIIPLLVVSGCSTSKVTYVGPDASYGSGIMASGFARVSSGRFSLTDATGVTCSGNYSSWDDTHLKFPVWCTDGKSGTVELNRSDDGKEGIGTIQVTDGEPKQIAFN
ncbi:hypothetical protein AAIH70_28250 [Neorhizobium sp. BT27B]|uniref:hypothetical protein n=1 Tax=Neorhizobium sp. BT27B TaxID=3142625 RepID=UPI003D2755FE